MRVYGQLLRAGLEQLAADPTGGDNFVGRIYWNTTENQAKVYNGTAWAGIGAGGGIGAFLDFYAAPGGGPLEEEDGNGLKFFEFQDGEAEILWGFLKVPETYLAGDQLFLAVNVESLEAGGNELKLQAQTYLVRSGTDSIASVANSNTNEQAYSPGSVVSQELVLELTNASGQINSVAVSPGDILKIALSKPADASTENLKLYPSLVEVR